MKWEFAVELPPELAIPTANRLFRPRRQGDHVYLYKSPKAVIFQQYLIASFSKQTAVSKIKALHAEIPLLLDIALQFTFVSRFFLRDTSNAIKATEDALVSVLGIDDSQFLGIAGRKHQAPPTPRKLRKTRRERIVVSITAFARDQCCHCGCHMPAQIATRTDRARGVQAYRPYRYNPGHAPDGQETPRLDDDPAGP